MNATITVQRRWMNRKEWYVLVLNVSGTEKVTGFFLHKIDAFIAATSVTDALRLASYDVEPIAYNGGE